MPLRKVERLAGCLLILCACSDEVQSPGSGGGGGDGGQGATGSGGGAPSDCVLSEAACADELDCPMGYGCNLQLPEPRCQELYCGAAGTPCSSGELCEAQSCTGGLCGGAPVGECGDVAATVGTYYLAVSLNLSPKQPIVFLQSVTADGAGLALSLQPLDAADRGTPVGSAIAVTLPLGADGTFDVQIPGANIPAEANPISGTAIVADLRLTGTACPDGFCGDVTGQTSQPLEVDLKNSTFSAVPVTRTAYPPAQPQINCAGDVADPL